MSAPRGIPAALLAPARRALAGRDGVALLIALFVVTLMTLTVIDFAYTVQVDANVASNGSDDMRAFYLARSAQRAGALLLQAGDDTPDRDGKFDHWADPSQLVLIQLENRGLIATPQGRVYLGPVDENCSPAVRDPGASATEGAGLQDIIVDENRKLSLGNLVKNRGAPNEAADFLTLLMLKNLFANYVESKKEALSEALGSVDSYELADQMVSALVDWTDTESYAKPHKFAALEFGAKVGDREGTLPQDALADRVATQLDSYEGGWYASARREEPTDVYVAACGTDPAPEVADGPILDLLDLCHLAGFYELFSADREFPAFLERTVTPYPTAGLNILTAPKEVVGAIPSDPRSAAAGGDNSSLEREAEYADLVGGVGFAQGNTNVVRAFQNGPVGFLQAAVKCVDQENCEGPPPTDYGDDPQYFGAYRNLAVTSDVFTVVGTGCMDYAVQVLNKSGEVEDEYLKRDPVIKQVRAVYRRSGGGSAKPGTPAGPVALTPIAWKVD